MSNFIIIEERKDSKLFNNGISIDKIILLYNEWTLNKRQKVLKTI